MVQTVKGGALSLFKKDKAYFYAPNDKAFWNNDGKIFHSLSELASGLRMMTDEKYRYHANETKNDYAKWVREVIADDKAADALEKAVDRVDAAKKLEDGQ